MLRQLRVWHALSVDKSNSVPTKGSSADFDLCIAQIVRLQWGQISIFGSEEHLARCLVPSSLVDSRASPKSAGRRRTRSFPLGNQLHLAATVLSAHSLVATCPIQKTARGFQEPCWTVTPGLVGTEEREDCLQSAERAKQKPLHNSVKPNDDHAYKFGTGLFGRITGS